MEKNDKEFRRKYDDADRNLYGGVDIHCVVFMCLSSVVSSADIYIWDHMVFMCLSSVVSSADIYIWDHTPVCIQILDGF